MILKNMIRTDQDIRTKVDGFVKTIDYPIPIVLDANWVNGLGVIRSLGHIGLRSIAINYDRTGVGLYSKFALGIVGPNPWNDACGLVDTLINIGSLLPEKGVLFATDDKYLEVLSAAKEVLQPYYHFSFPDIDVLRNLLDKQVQYAAAEKAGLSHPRSLIIRDVNDLNKWEKDAFPMVIKGVSGKEFFQYFGRQALEVKTYNEAKAIIQNGINIDYMVQEIIPGGEENLYTLGCYMSSEGEAKGIFTGRKLRQYPRYYGTCTVGESVICDDIIENSISTLRALNFQGIAQVECKHDPRDEKLKLIEINGRFWKWHSLATATGVNLAACAYRDITGWGNYTPCTQKYGLKWVVLLEDLRGVRQDIRAKEFYLMKWLRTISPPFISGLFDWKDLKPFLMKVYFFLKMKLIDK
jgi:D-aspartate ligase